MLHKRPTEVGGSGEGVPISEEGILVVAGVIASSHLICLFFVQVTNLKSRVFRGD